MTDSEPVSADRDGHARSALWRAIRLAADDVRHRFKIGAVRGCDGAPIRAGDEVPDVPTWQLVEALSLLGVIVRSQDATATALTLFGKSGPMEIQEDGVVRYIWAQQTLRGERSDLKGRPDLIVTSSRTEPHAENAIRIIEAKCIKQLGTQTIRSEFGKAHDLRVATYFIWSFYTPSAKVVEGARGLGIDLEALGFDSEWRPDLLAKPEALISHVAHAQEQARRVQRFAGVLEHAARQARRKLLEPPQ